MVLRHTVQIATHGCTAPIGLFPSKVCMLVKLWFVAKAFLFARSVSSLSDIHETPRLTLANNHSSTAMDMMFTPTKIPSTTVVCLYSFWTGQEARNGRQENSRSYKELGSRHGTLTLFLPQRASLTTETMAGASLTPREWTSNSTKNNCFWLPDLP